MVSEIVSAAATSGLLFPATTRRATCRSRAVRPYASAITSANS